MTMQAQISLSNQQSCIGQIRTVLCEGFDELENMYFGRDFSNGPDVDGKVFFKARHPVIKIGDFISVKITQADEYDLFGQAL